MARLNPALLNGTLLLLAVLTVALCAFARASYYLPATLLVVYAVVGAFAGFERNGTSARRMTLMAALCALAVISRVIFAPVPFFKPIAGIVMLSGVALGARSGFLVGSVAMLASNVLFGQGPWTPWQMLAFGLDGLVFGALADRGLLARSRWEPTMRALAGLFGAALVLLVSGPLLDTCSVLVFSTGAFTVEGAVAIYLAGLVPNALLSIATFLTLFFLAPPFLAMMARVESKYGIGGGDALQSGRI